MKTLFVAAGPIEWGSSRIRCYWPAEHMEDTQVITFDDLIRMVKEENHVPDAEVYVWQKQVSLDLMKAIPARHWYDICDPMHWFSPKVMRDVDDLVEGVVASSSPLGSDYGAWANRVVNCIPDRMNLDHYNQQREHEKASPVRLIWFGVAVNRIALAASWANLSRLTANSYDLTLTVLDDQPDASQLFGDEVSLDFSLWSLENEVSILSSHDIALLPPYPGPWGKVKSNNKRLTAWACGLPVADGLDYWELVSLIEDVGKRRKRGERGRKDVEFMWDVRKSAEQWERLLWD